MSQPSPRLFQYEETTSDDAHSPSSEASSADTKSSSLEDSPLNGNALKLHDTIDQLDISEDIAKPGEDCCSIMWKKFTCYNPDEDNSKHTGLWPEAFEIKHCKSCASRSSDLTSPVGVPIYGRCDSKKLKRRIYEVQLPCRVCRGLPSGTERELFPELRKDVEDKNYCEDEEDWEAVEELEKKIIEHWGR
ncbi:MAG: hypothetical protein MMC33_004946 [Icmadophila ericetorum]|nr:hypothetical protein [Icmadophila ericetorum]